MNLIEKYIKNDIEVKIVIKQRIWKAGKCVQKEVQFEVN